MAFCSKCGKELEENAKVCPDCGTPVQESTQKDTQNKANDFVSKVNNGSDYTETMDASDIEKNKVMAILSYIGILFLVPLLAAKDSAYAKFHTNQGIVLCLIEIAANVIGGVLSALTAGIFGFIMIPVHLLFLAFMILGIVNAAQGKAKELPLIGKIRILK